MRFDCFVYGAAARLGVDVRQASVFVSWSVRHLGGSTGCVTCLAILIGCKRWD